MTLQFEDVLNAICSQVKEWNSNDFQKVYALATPTEAKLAFDVLVAHGFDVKVYHQDGKMSKLYVTHPTQSPEQLEEILTACLAYGKTLKQIKASLDALCSEENPVLHSPQFSMTFANAQPHGKQLLVMITPASGAAEALSSSAPIEAVAAPAVAAQAPAPLASSQPKKRGPKVKGHYEELSSGPSVARASYPGALAADGTSKQNSARRRMMLYLFGNMATSSYAMLIQMIILGAIFTVFVFIKGMLCADFATFKNDAWYCRSAVEINEKPKQQSQPGQPAQR